MNIVESACNIVNRRGNSDQLPTGDGNPRLNRLEYMFNNRLEYMLKLTGILTCSKTGQNTCQFVKTYKRTGSKTCSTTGKITFLANYRYSNRVENRLEYMLVCENRYSNMFSNMLEYRFRTPVSAITGIRTCFLTGSFVETYKRTCFLTCILTCQNTSIF